MQELGIPREAVEMTEAVQELGQGQWEGRLRSEIYTPAMLSVLNSTQPDFGAPGGESQRQVEFRMIEFFNNVALPRASVAVQAARVYRQRGSKEHLNKSQHASIQVTHLCRTYSSTFKSVCPIVYASYLFIAFCRGMFLVNDLLEFCSRWIYLNRSDLCYNMVSAP